MTAVHVTPSGTKTFHVRGIRCRTRSPRRYAVVYVRPEATEFDGNTYQPYARVEKRTDNLATARRECRRFGYSPSGAFQVIVDTTTGEEIR